MFPKTRMKRLRTSSAMRKLVSGTNIAADNLIYPLFVCPGNGIKKPIESMKDCFHFSPDMLETEAKKVFDLGIPAVLLFGQAEKKDAKGSQAYNNNAPLQQAVKNINRTCPDILVITDVCLCAYTDHGHCGIIKNDKIDNDATCELLAKTAVSHAVAGADMVAPSDMADGRVGVIRSALDKTGFCDTAIMSYAAKYASAFYGPFRDALDSAPAFGDRKTYQADFAASPAQAMREIELDIAEGADIVMIKPAGAYLDIICRAKKRFDVPIAAYQVSGEYMMLNKAAEAGLMDSAEAMLETLIAIKRAGADIIITYFAKEMARLCRNK